MERCDKECPKSQNQMNVIKTDNKSLEYHCSTHFHYSQQVTTFVHFLSTPINVFNYEAILNVPPIKWKI
jgi:hypothetical protein